MNCPLRLENLDSLDAGPQYGLVESQSITLPKLFALLNFELQPLYTIVGHSSVVENPESVVPSRPDNYLPDHITHLEGSFLKQLFGANGRIRIPIDVVGSFPPVLTRLDIRVTMFTCSMILQFLGIVEHKLYKFVHTVQVFSFGRERNAKEI